MESKRIQSIAIQTGVAEDIEQRRRCMHLKEEAEKQKGAQQVSSLVKTGLVSLNHVEPVIKSVPLSTSDTTKVKRNMRRAGRVAADVGRAASSAAGNALLATAGLPVVAAQKGAEVASDATNAVLNKASDLGHATANAASDLGHATANTAASAANAASDLGHATANAAADLGHATANTAASAAHKVADTTANVAQAAANTATSAANAAVDLGHATANTAVSAAHKVADTTANVAQAAVDTASSAAHIAANTAVSAAQLAANTASSAAHMVVDTTANALSTAANLGSAAAHVAANTAVNAAQKTVEVGQIAADYARPAAAAALHKAADVVETGEVVAQEAAQVAANTAVIAAQKTVEAGQVAAEYARPAAAAALHKAADAVEAGEVAAMEAAEAAKPAAKSLFSKAVDLGYRAAGFGTAVASSALHMAADVGSSVLQTAGEYANHYMTSAHRTFLRGQEEIERLRRQTSEEEHWAVLNAFNAAQCVRGWRQSKNMDVPLAGKHVEAYWVRLLEEIERARRIASPVTPKRNMNKIASMLKDTRFNPLSAEHLDAIKLNHVYAPVAAPIEAPKSVAVAPVESVMAHHVPTSAVNAAPFVPASQTPVNYVPVDVSSANGNYVLPKLDLASIEGNGEKVVVFYPVLAQQSAPLDASKETLSSAQPLGRAAM